MTTLLIGVLGFFFVYAVYVAALTARCARTPEDYLDGGSSLPPWCFLFAGTGVVIAGVGLYDHYLLLALYGLQYNHVALGVVLAALAGVLVQKRLLLAARISGHRTLGDLLGAYYGSVTLRVLALLLVLLFALPFAGQSLSRLGALIASATGDTIERAQAIWACAFFLFLAGAIGGWRGTIYALGAQSVLLVTLIVFVGVGGSTGLGWTALLHGEVPAPQGVLTEAIPGVMQYSAGIGKETTSGGLWTAMAVFSQALAFIGIVLSPAFALLGITTRPPARYAFKQVWLTAGLATGVLLVAAPFIGAGVALAQPGPLQEGAVAYAGVLGALVDFDAMLAVGFVLMLVAALQIVVAFFAQSGASLFVIELLGRDLLPDLSPAGRRLTARITLGAIYLAIAVLAAYAPLLAEIGGGLALSLSAQLLPALIGLCWVRWISRSAVITGLVFGILLVLFTEPLGLLVFESLFVELPWGRWPLTIHSAGWGLAFNLAACLLASIFTARDAERDARDRLHDVFLREHRQDLGGPAARGAKWSLILIWAFFALGPGAILGNEFFSDPMFSELTPALLLPSLWVWQILFWLLGVFIAWWLAYKAGMSILDRPIVYRLRLEPERAPFERGAPRWLEQFVKRVAPRQP
jgi:Na+/proline symporter